MLDKLCCSSAFYYHRLPPQVKALCPRFPDVSSLSGKRELLARAKGFFPLPLPLHVLAVNHPYGLQGKSIQTHIWNGPLPQEAFWHDEDLDVTYASPLFTLLTLAPCISLYQLAMVAFELCGTFSVYKPSDDIQKELDRICDQRLTWAGEWRQVKDYKNKPTSLWRRDPLIELDDLRRFVQETKGMRGNVDLARAIEMVTGVTASPLEVQASLLLGLSRSMGGEGLGPFVNNQRIPLSEQARKLAGQSTCFADVFFEANDRHRDIDVELQGHMIHDGGIAGGLDANRSLGLQAMGIEVVHLTSEQLSNAERFRETASYLAKKLGIMRKPKSPKMLEREQKLRRSLFINWETLGA
mgnify:CR=1 FL=1